MGFPDKVPLKITRSRIEVFKTDLYFSHKVPSSITTLSLILEQRSTNRTKLSSIGRLQITDTNDDRFGAYPFPVN